MKRIGRVIGLGTILVVTFLIKTSGFTQPNILISTEELASILGQPGVVVIDARFKEFYDKGHIPGAVSLPWKASVAEMKDPVYMKQTGFPLRSEKAEEIFGGVGISSNTRVVVYDSPADREATFIWAMLKTYGHDNVQLLAGGIKNWKKEKRPVTTEVPQVKPAIFKANPRPEVVATAEYIMKNKDNIQLLDGRNLEEYTGAATVGRIPGAIHLEWINIASAKGTFKSPDEVRELLSKKGITPDKEVVVYCQTHGDRASALYAVLKMLGDKTRIYWEAMEGWARDLSAPIVK